MCRLGGGTGAELGVWGESAVVQVTSPRLLMRLSVFTDSSSYDDMFDTQPYDPDCYSHPNTDMKSSFSKTPWEHFWGIIEWNQIRHLASVADQIS